MQHGNSLVDEMNHRLVKIPRFNNLKIFKNGLQSISRLIANKYHNLIKVMVFVIDNLYNENTNSIENFIMNTDLAKVYKKWNNMYKISRYEMFKESDLNKFEVQHIQLYLNSLCLYIEINVSWYYSCQ